jgi:hypothetical protein
MSFDELAEWPDDEIKEAIDQGKLFQVDDADGIICRQCLEGCWKEIEIKVRDGLPVKVIRCEEEDCAGIIPVETKRLWQYKIIGDKKPKEENIAYWDKKFAELIKELQAKNPDGAVKKYKYKWQKVLKKVEDYWKKYKTEEKKKGVIAKDVFFPSQRSIAREIGENVGTVKKAILYSRSLTRAYNKGKPASKKVKFIDPSKLDFVGPKIGRKGGKPDPAYEEQKECLLGQIKKAAHKESNNFDPDVKVYGDMILRNMKAISGLHLEGLKELLGDLTGNRTNRLDKFEAAFNTDKL